jgi:GNAT superfamily N-acetyltransferase
MSWQIRPIEAADLEIARAVISSYVAELEEVDEAAAQRARTEADELCTFPQIRKNYLRSSGMLFVMTDRDRVIGLGGARKVSAEVCQLRHLVLLRPFRGRGLGHEMALSLIEWARDNGYQEVRLEVPRSQTDAQKLFARLHFAILEPASLSRSDGPTELAYELDLHRKLRPAP